MATVADVFLQSCVLGVLEGFVNAAKHIRKID
jgi:hypothetical protein